MQTIAETNVECDIAGLLLAAGSSSRAGLLNKLLYTKPLNGKATSMIATSASALQAAGLGLTVAVTGVPDEQIAEQLKPLGLSLINNPDSKQGMGTSLKVGVSRLQHADAVLVCLADMPDIQTSTLKSIISCWRSSSRDKFIVPMYQGRRGNPVVIPRCFYSAIDQLSGDTGARALLKRNPERVIACKVDTPSVLTDFDTREQLIAAGWSNPKAEL